MSPPTLGDTCFPRSSIQILISRNTGMDIPRNHFKNIWAPRGPVKLIHKINHPTWVGAQTRDHLSLLVWAWVWVYRCVQAPQVSWRWMHILLCAALHTCAYLSALQCVLMSTVPGGAFAHFRACTPHLCMQGCVHTGMFVRARYSISRDHRPLVRSFSLSSPVAQTSLYRRCCVDMEAELSSPGLHWGPAGPQGATGDGDLSLRREGSTGVRDVMNFGMVKGLPGKCPLCPRLHYRVSTDMNQGVLGPALSLALKGGLVAHGGLLHPLLPFMEESTKALPGWHQCVCLPPVVLNLSLVYKDAQSRRRLTACTWSSSQSQCHSHGVGLAPNLSSPTERPETAISPLGQGLHRLFRFFSEGQQRQQ